MKRVILAAAVIGAGASAAIAGGLDRTGQPIGILFEDGRYFEFSFGAVSPDVSGVGVLLTPGMMSGDMTESYFQFSAAYKADINENFSYAVIFDQPFGADVAYPTGTGYFAGGSTASLDTYALTGVLKYTTESNVSVYAGARAQSLQAEAVVPFVAGYSASTETDFGFGYLAGAAYEKPEIALRVALTYNSEIEHNLATTEISASPLGGPNLSTTNITTPQSVNLDVQTGIAEGTLLFGGIRWVDWSEFDISPADYILLTPSGSPLVSYPNDVVTYTLGLGRRLNDNWSVAGSVNYEKHHGDLTGNLGPTDGRFGATLAAIYTRDNLKVTAGVSYVDVGNADTFVGAPVPGGSFTGNSAIGAGVRVGFSF